MSKASIVVLASGFGSNLQVILDQIKSGQLDVQLKAVLSDRPDSQALQRAVAAGVAAVPLYSKAFSDRAAFDAELQRKLELLKPDLIVLAGYMRILSDSLVERFQGQMINIHPSLLPKYPGLHTHQRVLDAGDTEHGTSVHFVTPELDSGPVILQARVPVYENDDVDDLKARIQTQEHRIYPLVINWFCSDRLAFVDGTAILDGHVLPEAGYAAD